MSPPLGSQTTAEQALRGISLSGMRAIVTGANSGLGVETTRALALAGAEVVMGCRSVSSGEEVAQALRQKLPQGSGRLQVQRLDLADLESVRAFAQAFLAAQQPLQLLINNAGVMSTPLGRTSQGFETQMGVNHLGHYFLTLQLRPALESARSARVVNVSSQLHRQGRGERILETLGSDRAFEKRRYSPFGAYCDSKLANVLFTRALRRRWPESIKAFSLHPGVINTNLSRNMGGPLSSLYRAVGGLFMKSVAQGAATSVFAATAPELESQSGAYLSDCQVASPAPEAQDDALADRVWDLSEQCVTGALRV